MCAVSQVKTYCLAIACTALVLLPPLLAISRAGADISLSVIGFIFLMHSMLERDVSWLRKEVLALFGFWLFMVLSSLINQGHWPEISHALGWVRFPLVYAALRYWLLVDRQRLEWFCSWTVIVLGVVACDALYQHWDGVSLSGRPMYNGVRLTGPLSHPNVGNYFTKLMFPASVLLMYRALKNDNKIQAVAILCLILLYSSVVLLSGERSASLLMLLGVGTIEFGALVFLPGFRRQLIAFGIVFALMMITLHSTQNFMHQRSQKLLSDVNNFWHTPYGQLYIGSFTLWKEHPLLGIGPGNFLTACPPLKNAGIVTYCDMHSHNIHIQALVETGLLGYACFALAIVLILIQGLRTLRHTKDYERLLPLGGLAISIIVFFPLIVTQGLFSNWAASLLWVALGIGMAVTDMPAKNERA